MTTPIISRRQANRFLLRQQHLLAPCGDPVQAARDACGLQAQVPSSPALALRARVARFTLADYDRLLRTDRELVRTWALRGTVHVVASDELYRYTRLYAGEGIPSRWSPWANGALDMLQDGPQTRKQLAARATRELGLSPQQAAEVFGPWGGVLRLLAREGLTVHVPAEGADVPVARSVDWLGTQPPFPNQESLEDALLEAYVGGYGPVSVQDLAHFTGLSLGWAATVMTRAKNLSPVTVEGSKLPYFVRSSDLAALLSTTGLESTPVQLLPRFDSLILAHKDKSRVLGHSWRKHVFGAGAQVEAVVLIDGFVAGTWRAKVGSRSLRFHFNPFEPQPAELVETEARRLAEWYGLEHLSFEVRAEGPQAAVAARAARVAETAKRLHIPKPTPHDAYKETLRDGELIHVAALPGLATQPDRIAAEAEQYLAWMRAHRLRAPRIEPENIRVRPVHATLSAINPRPGRHTAALIDADFAPLTDEELRRTGAILHEAALDATESRRHAEMLGWLMSRCTNRKRKIHRNLLAQEELRLTGEDLVAALLDLSLADRKQVVDRAGEPWNTRKVLRRAIQYLREHKRQL